MALIACTRTLQSTIDWAGPYTYFRNLAIGTGNEPAISAGSTVLQTILGPPFCWRWNRAAISSFNTVAGRQDYAVSVADFGFLERATITPAAVAGEDVTFVLSGTPNPPASLMLFLNGILQTDGIDYTLVGSEVIFNSAPSAGDIISAFYRTNGATSNYVDANVPTGSINGSNVTFVLTGGAPAPTGSLMLFKNGQFQVSGTDYTLSGSTITMIVAPATGDTLIAWYHIGSPSGFTSNETPTGSINSFNRKFTLATSPNATKSLTLFLNGVEQTYGVDYTLYGSVIVFLLAAPSTGDSLVAFYQTAGASGFVFADILPVNPGTAKAIEITELTNVLGTSTDRGQPHAIAPYLDDNNGTVTFRFMAPPDQAYSVNLLYQKRSPTFTALTQLWSPIPDYMSYVYNQGFLAFMNLYTDDSRWGVELQRFLGSLIGASEGLDETQKSMFLDQWNLSSGQSAAYQQKLLLGVPSRSSLK